MTTPYAPPYHINAPPYDAVGDIGSVLFQFQGRLGSVLTGHSRNPTSISELYVDFHYMMFHHESDPLYSRPDPGQRTVPNTEMVDNNRSGQESV